MVGRWLAPERSRRLIATLPVLVGAAFVLTGCGKVTGGGWMQSLAPGGKATFGFVAKCKNTTTNGMSTATFFGGQFEYDDHAANPLVRVHGEVVPNEFFNIVGRTCQDVAHDDTLPMIEFSGHFQTQSGVTPSMQGDFTVRVADGGKGAMNLTGDEMQVDLRGTDALHPLVYFNTGVVQEGNITIQ